MDSPTSDLNVLRPSSIDLKFELSIHVLAENCFLNKTIGKEERLVNCGV